MADVLDQIQQEGQKTLTDLVGQEKHDTDWSGFFGDVPPSDVLRKQQDLSDLVSTAVDNRQRIAAQTDRNAQEIYYNRKKFEDYQQQEPLRDALLQSRINHENALTEATGRAQLFKQQQNENTAKQVSGFYTDFSAIDAEHGTPEYKTAVLGLASKYPLAVVTPEVRQDLRDAVKVHSTIEDLRKKIPDGYMQGNTHISATGDLSMDIVPKGKLFDSLAEAKDAIPGASNEDFRQTKDGFEYVPSKIPESSRILYADVVATLAAIGTPDEVQAKIKANQEAYARNPTPALEAEYHDLVNNKLPLSQKAQVHKDALEKDFKFDDMRISGATDEDEGTIATNPKTGEKVVWKDGKWQAQP